MAGGGDEEGGHMDVRAETAAHLRDQTVRCADEVDELSRRLHRLSALDWDSPAGRAFRERVEELRSLLANLFGQLADAAVAIGRHVDALEALPAAAPDRWS